MKKIKIFLASSEELKEERKMMAELANGLNTVLERQDVQVIVVEWENLDSSIGVRHKQEDYNEKLRECDLCVVLWWQKFGGFTKREFDVALEGFQSGQNPRKIYVYFKDGGTPTEELKAFRESFPDKYSHFVSQFVTEDALKADFLLQFMGYQSQTDQKTDLVEIRDGQVLVGEQVYVRLQNVPFAGNNKEYNHLKEMVQEREENLMEMDPEHPRYQEKADKLKETQQQLRDFEASLWKDALDLTRMCAQQGSERLQRARVCFNQGDRSGAAAILKEEEIYRDADRNVDIIKLGEEGRKNLLSNIEELQLKMQLLEPATDVPKVVNAAYEQRSAILTKIIDYTAVLYGECSKEVYRQYEGAARWFRDQPKRVIPFLEKAWELAEQLGDADKIIFSCNALSFIYKEQGDETQWADYRRMVLKVICEKYGQRSGRYVDYAASMADELAVSDPAESRSWFEYALSVFQTLPNVAKEKEILTDRVKLLSVINSDWESLERYMIRLQELSTKKEMLAIYLKIAGTVNVEMAVKYTHEALVYATDLADVDAQARIFKVLARVYGTDGKFRDIDKQIVYLNKAIEIEGASCDWYTYDALAAAYLLKGDYSNAIANANNCLALALEQNNCFGVLRSYNKMSLAAQRLGDFDGAVSSLQNAVAWSIQRKDRDTLLISYKNLAHLYVEISQAEKALDIYTSCIKPLQKRSSLEDLAWIERMTGWLYFLTGDALQAEQCYAESVNLILESRADEQWATKDDIRRSNLRVAAAYYHFAWFYAVNKEYAKAEEMLQHSDAACGGVGGYGLRYREYCRGVVCRGNQAYQKAIDLFRASKKQIGADEAQAEIALTLLEWGKREEAAEVASQLVGKDFEKEDVHRILGIIYKELNQP